MVQILKRKRIDYTPDDEFELKISRKILVAVDLQVSPLVGTTFSALAWAQTRNPETQTPIIQWPDAISGGLEGITSDKVPTELQYEGQDYKWGFQIPEFSQRHQWFKLGLDPSHNRTTELSATYPDPLAAPPVYAAEAEKPVTDYLTALRIHSEHILKERLPQSVLNTTSIEYIITVPAVWSDAAQAKTRACAEQAGMGVGSTLHIISEPEAAAMYALSEEGKDQDLEVGDTFVLCDAGGGTVDLITYTISALKPILQVTEASAGSGDLCGGSFLNRRFQRFLEEKLGQEPGWDEEVLEEATNRFETSIKRSYGGACREEYSVPVPGLRDNARLSVRRGKMRMPGHELRAIFEPVLKNVSRLVMGQIAASKEPVKTVLLVGGFGQSAYLRDFLRKEVRYSGADVRQSRNGWTAVVRGALMKALASTSPSFATVRISGRYARKHYGVESSKIFEPGKHVQSKRFFSYSHQSFMIYTMDWFITKGTLVEEDTPIRLRYSQKRAKSSGPFTTISTDIYCFSDPTNTGAPLYANHRGTAVTKLVTVSADLSRIPLHLIREVRTATKKVYYQIGYEIEVTYYSGSTKYELVHEGVNYGAVRAEYV